MVKSLLVWDPVPDATHYRIYVRAEGGIYSTPFATIADTFLDLQPIPETLGFYPLNKMYFVVTAYDPGTGIEGYSSVEISWDVPFPAPLNLRLE